MESRRLLTARTIRFVVVVILLVLYVVPFWGSFRGRFWPGPVRDYAGWAMRAAWRWYCQHVGVGGGNVAFQHHLVWLAVSVILGAVVPLVVMAALRRRPSDVGLGLPNRWGRRMILVGLAIVLPMSLVFAFERRAKPDPVAAAIDMREGLILIGVSVPEHVLLTGVVVALLLPGMRLPERAEDLVKGGALARAGRRPAQPDAGEDRPVTCAPGSDKDAGGGGSARSRVLRRLGLGLPARPGDSAGRRLLAWWGLEPDGWWAILGGGLLFGIVHVGARPIEFTTSFPGGLLLCYVTYRSRSIWPGWCVHVAQMTLVMGFIALFGAARR